MDRGEVKQYRPLPASLPNWKWVALSDLAAKVEMTPYAVMKLAAERARAPFNASEELAAERALLFLFSGCRCRDHKGKHDHLGAVCKDQRFRMLSLRSDMRGSQAECFTSPDEVLALTPEIFVPEQWALELEEELNSES